MAISAFNQELLSEYEYYLSDDMDTDDKRLNTCKNYISDVRQFLDYLSDKKCTATSRKDATEWIKSLVTSSGEPIKAATRNRKISSLNSFYNTLIEEKYTDKNPFKNVKLEKIKKGKNGNQLTRDMLDSNEIKALRSAIEKELKHPQIKRGMDESKVKMNRLRDRAIINLILSCGLRVNELCILELSELEYTEIDGRKIGKIHIPEEKDKNKKGRYVPVPLEVMVYIREYFDSIEFEPDNSYVFVSQNGNALRHKDINAIVQKYCKLAGIKKHITPHGLRHTCATQMIYAGNDLAKIAQCLGHSVDMLMKTYFHQTDDSLDIVLKF